MAKVPACDTEEQFRNKGGICCDVCDAGRSTVPAVCNSFGAVCNSFGLRPSECDGFRHFSQFTHVAALFVSPGKYVKAECDNYKATQCVPCQDGFYTATKNHMSSCHLCRVCSPSESCSTVLELLNAHTRTRRHTLALAGYQPLVQFFLTAAPSFHVWIFQSPRFKIFLFYTLNPPRVI